MGNNCKTEKICQSNAKFKITFNKKPINMGAYKKPTYKMSSITRNTSTEGETIETKIERLLENGAEPNDPKVPLIYTDRKDGVIAAYDPKTSRFDLALEANDKITRSELFRREQYYRGDDSQPDASIAPDNISGAEPTGGE